MTEILWAVVIGLSIALVGGIWRTVRQGNPSKRMEEYSAGRAVCVPLAIEFTHESNRLPAATRQLNSFARAECDPYHGLGRVKGATTVPGFQRDDFWCSLRDRLQAETVRMDRSDGVVRFVVPLQAFPSMGVAGVVDEIDWQILTHALRRGLAEI